MLSAPTAQLEALKLVYALITQGNTLYTSPRVEYILIQCFYQDGKKQNNHPLNGKSNQQSTYNNVDIYQMSIHLYIVERNWPAQVQKSQ